MSDEHPYRFAEARPIFSDEAELAAIAELAARKSRLQTWINVICLSAAAVLSVLMWPLVTVVQFALIGVAFFAITGVVAFGVALTGGFVAAWLLARTLLRARAEAWLSATSERHGVPVQQLRWVLQHGAEKDLRR